MPISLSTPGPEPTVEPSSNEEEVPELDSFCSKMNDRIHKQIKVITAADAASPYDISQFDINATISNIDPVLWRTIVRLTATITENRSTYHQIQ